MNGFGINVRGRAIELSIIHSFFIQQIFMEHVYVPGAGGSGSNTRHKFLNTR